jgi:hypothetical protein
MKTLVYLVGALLQIAWVAVPARGDGGTVQIRETHGAVQVTVFTSPTPLRVGLIDASVLVQDSSTGATLTDAEIEIVVHPVDAPHRAQRCTASSERAVNKLLRAAEFELTAPGPTEFEVIVESANRPHVQLRFQADVAPALPRWVAYWAWFTWPALVVVLFAIRQRFGGRRRREVS